jgi:diguanylate cyclase (GGDEF)-like protein
VTSADASGPVQRGPAPVFVLSFGYRDEMAVCTEQAGWKAIAARRAKGVERRFIASGAPIIVVDGRGALEEALAAMVVLADAVQAHGAALMAIIDTSEVEQLPRVLELGATQYLLAPFSMTEYAQALRFAERMVTRIAGGVDPAALRVAIAGQAQSWRWRPGSTNATVSASLADRLGIESDIEVPLASLLRSIDRGGRKLARTAIAKLLGTRSATAFAHGGEAGSERIAHHLHYDEASGMVVARLEEPDPQTNGLEAGRRDPLTGVLDGLGARRWIEAQVRGTGGGGPDPTCTLLMLAITRFDMINAAFGRATGDVLMKAVARRIEGLLAASGFRRRMLARMAGAEFAVAVAGAADVDEVVQLAVKIAEALSEPFISGDHVVTISCRIGVAQSETGEQESSPLLRRASLALAEAGSGEALVRVYSPRGEARRVEHGQLEVDLRKALQQDEIELLFQPQVDIASGRVIGVEALARWYHPTRGEVGAVPLFAAAQRSDYVRELSVHVQRKAVQLAAGWPTNLDALRLAINVTAADIGWPGFAGQFAAMVEECGFDPRRITVEITENGLIEDLPAAAKLLTELRDSGFRIAIDDFGTGYSSLAYLQALPLDYIKLDRQLSKGIVGSTRDKVVVVGAIEMARSLGLAVVAEGVETQEQLDLLTQSGCDSYQGYLCAPPLSAVELSALIGARQRD